MHTKMIISHLEGNACKPPNYVTRNTHTVYLLTQSNAL